MTTKQYTIQMALLRDANAKREQLIAQLRESLVDMVRDAINEPELSDADKLRFMDLICGKGRVEDPWRATEACRRISDSGNDALRFLADEAGALFSEFSRHFVPTSRETGV